MDLHIETVDGHTYLSGDTYAAKHIIKRHGGRWDGFRQAWGFGSETAARVCADEVGPHLAMMQELQALEAM